MEFNITELNPYAIGMGLIGGAFILYMMGNTGKVSLGIFWKLMGFIVGSVACYFVANFILNRD